MGDIRVVVDGAGGRMGRMVTATIQREPGVSVVGAVDVPGSPLIGQDVGTLAGVGELGVPVVDALASVVDGADVVIEFTLPEATLANLRVAVERDKRMVIATTGFDSGQAAELDALAANIPCVMASNYSIGVNALIKAVTLMAETLGDDYDIEIVEAHHNQKVDAPSGTAVTLLKAAAEGVQRNVDDVANYGREGIVGARPPKEIGVHAVRGGDIVGDHTVMFVGMGERVELTHRAQSRQTFANGAIRAARWLMTAPPGMHSFAKVLFGEE
ncbi:4-hydroxy-tetrahydrodipicolinate reductase [Candidatus Poribacteria bacterium]|jgi:4-hydroxy-tetrahydrodipicolinate reductase|nr:4-hydroxy-tetrahydrodipicolinate reductase [Candidatus Poribacteria bacterium]MBT5535209.1 4-hydroxy-tetrahydrodipicolinate reductase [Candidatus Poribacteria bacterium]MBT5712275.1 4-hydroxy-tetrahydrodipicolinate reductase [Candidatus Poribacteria bacterium]MBT7804576.1 4-hydroxy-tetrahydrodipicolinate reductase [Candidatus Poribacteria bacterium]